MVERYLSFTLIVLVSFPMDIPVFFYLPTCLSVPSLYNPFDPFRLRCMRRIQKFPNHRGNLAFPSDLLIFCSTLSSANMDPRDCAHMKPNKPLKHATSGDMTIHERYIDTYPSRCVDQNDLPPISSPSLQDPRNKVSKYTCSSRVELYKHPTGED